MAPRGGVGGPEASPATTAADGTHITSSSSTGCCSTTTAASTELRLYQAFIFSVPIFFTLLLIFLFYLFYLRHQPIDWTSLRMRAFRRNRHHHFSSNATTSEMGLKKELRELLPIVIFKETFSIKDTQCAVCLGEYQAEDRLQQIPGCSHTFHMECIDRWLSIHTTCPMCRLSLLPSAKASVETSSN